MTDRKFNFSAGPAVLPVEVLEEARENLLSLGDTGIGIMEHSHRGKAFMEVYGRTVSRCRKVASISDDYEILFLQGGASSQFYMIPMNFLDSNKTADYLVTGSWSKKAIKEAKRFGQTHTVCSSEETNFNCIPHERTYSNSPTYVHFTSNNTIYGTQFKDEPDCPDGAFLVCDASSDIFSRPIDISKYGIVYAGAQKNLGQSGVTLVIMRKELVESANSDLPTMLQYRTHAEHQSMFNTPPTFGIFIMNLIFKWILDQGGLSAMGERNRRKAKVLYDYLDENDLFQATAATDSRSDMNVTFDTGNLDTDVEFIATATKKGFNGLKGHRDVGGMRASIYNAFPEEGVTKLVALMKEFETKKQ